MSEDVALADSVVTRPTPNALAIPAIASAGAGVLHAAAAGIHAEHATLSRIFVAFAVAQAASAIAALVRPGRSTAVALVAVNLAAAVSWLVTRFVGISAIGGLEVAERAQLADAIAASLAVAAVVAGIAYLAGKISVVPGRAVLNGAIIAGILVVPGLAAATNHDHTDSGDHAHDGEIAAAGDAPEAVNGATVANDTDHDAAEGEHDDHADTDHDGHDTDTADHGDHADTDHEGHVTDVASADADHADHAVGEASAAWPRPWDPGGEVDFSGVAGVTAEQQQRAEQLVRDTLDELPKFADVTAVPALGYRSIGDAGTGFEHYINTAFIGDDKFLDPSAPESLVYEVDGDQRTLVSAMFIANQTPIDDPSLTDFGGPLMQWHVHDNLCWGLDDDGVPVVMGVLENFGGTCPTGTVNAGGENPMVHVWIGAHECGPFAALEGHGAGQAAAGDGERTDQCAHDGHDPQADAPATTPYDPTLPIDLGGLDGVTLEQQAFAENLVAATVRDLPQWADLDAVEAAGFRSIGDAATGHEHYIQWDWINDDVWLDPDAPESLVFERGPDGSKQLAAAMFMLPGATAFDDIPDWGGALMQWHVHGDLCFTSDPDAPKVAGTKPVGAPCSAPLVDGPLSPMIHVWIRAHECGPFAALEGIGGGQVPDGEEALCDRAHGAH